MAIKTDPDDLNQGSSLAVSGAIWATGTGADIRIHTAAANNLPALAANEFFEVRDHSQTVNNGLYRVVTVTTSTDDYECDKVSGSAPITAGAEAVTTLGATGAATEKSMYWDTAALEWMVLEQGNIDADGVNVQAIFSRGMKDWKDDDFIANQNVTFPMFDIDADAGKYLFGQDNQGNNSGWVPRDVSAFSIRTRKLCRGAGWDEIDSAGIRKAGWIGFGTLGAFEDAVNDKARYAFGTDASVNNSVEFDFAGPVNEAVQYYEEIGNPGPTLAFATTSTITRTTGSWITDGFVVGGQVGVRAAEDPANDGTHLLTGVSALTLTVSGTPFTINADDTTAQLAIDNSNAIRLRNRIRDADPNGKTYTQANLASGNYLELRSGFMTFPLSSVTDENISETDANIDANVPYTGMTLTVYATPQSLGSDLVGGPYNFGFVGNANTGTKTQFFEWVQRQLRKLTDINAGAGTVIGIMLDDLATFVGAELQLGVSSPTDGSVFPVNPLGGGSGFYVQFLNAASKNTTKMFDNTGTKRGFPVGTPITADINQTAIDDTTAELSLYLEYTIRNAVADLVVTAGTGANGTFDSVGSNLPATLDEGVGAYVRVSGFTGGDEAMNGIYQVTALTSQAQWNVTRRDGATIVTTASASANIDEHPSGSPSALLLNTDNDLTAATISFTAPDLINDSGNGLAIFAVGDFIRVEGSTGGTNDGIYEVATSAAGQLELVEQTITTQGAGPSVTITEVFKHAADADFARTFDYSGNVQGGRTGGTDASIVGRLSGAAVNGAAYTTSPPRTVQSATPLTITLSASVMRNFTP